MRFWLALISGKLARLIISSLRVGAGGTWPGEIALINHPNISVQLFKQLNKGVIIIAGTNGKTTTAHMVKTILQENGDKVIHNDTGANLLNGIISAMIKHASWSGDIATDWGVFEVDENSLPEILSKLKSQSAKRKSTAKSLKLVIVLLNLFRDQLDRYGEVDVIAEKWEKSLKAYSQQSTANSDKKSTLIVNADDPQVAFLGRTSPPPIGGPLPVASAGQASGKERGKIREKSVIYFGINDRSKYLAKKEHATDSIFCLNCGNRLEYEGIYYSHIGVWHCPSCKSKRPEPDTTSWPSPLPGFYNQYNTLAAVSVAQALGINKKTIDQSFKMIGPAFGRQEEFNIYGKTAKVFLSKNPVGFNESLKTVIEQKPQVILLVLNDRIPDGRDVSWIWDVDFEMLPEGVKIIVSGDRAYDMGLRIKYAQKSQITNPNFQINSPAKPDPASQEKSKFQNSKIVIEQELKVAIEVGLQCIKKGETLYILPTYSAMLEVRKLIGGRKIL